MASNATEIILTSIVIDRTRMRDVRQLFNSCTNLESRMMALAGYCERHIIHNLSKDLEVEVIPSLMAGTSWEDLVTRLDQELGDEFWYTESGRQRLM